MARAAVKERPDADSAVYNELSMDEQDAFDRIASRGFHPEMNGNSWSAVPVNDDTERIGKVGPYPNLDQLKIAVDTATDAPVLDEEFIEPKSTPERTRSDEIAEMFPVPDKRDFEGKQFLASDELKMVAATLIEKYPDDFIHLRDANIIYLWKEAGGETGGRAVLGKCIRPSGLAAYFAAPSAESQVDYVVWVAADHLRENRANHRTICALIFHELKHTEYSEGKFIVVGHEFEGFAREIEEFGMWQHAIKLIADACDTVKDQQQGLFTNH